VAGGVGRALHSRFDVAAARDAIALPAPASPAPALPAGVDLQLPGLTPFTTRNADFYRVDTALVLPQVPPEQWKLRITGRVGRELTLSYDDLLARDLIERDITLTCVSNEVGGNLAGHARWLGVPLRDLLDEVQPDDGADQVLSTSVDGWTCGTPTELCRTTEGAMLAVAMNGEPLPVAHGFPVRMIVPGLYGYVSGTKWITEMRLTSFADVDPYWVRRGWKAQAPIKVMSRIDTPRGLSEHPRGTVRIAGVAWAQTRGVARVECRVDGGPWQTATLAASGGTDTWRQWFWNWPADEPGLHTLEVRATDGAGTTQTKRRAKPFPDGATGWHSVVVTVV
nr:molybdopterin-dependent oxidoreductase [Actinomycetota bacterium]